MDPLTVRPNRLMHWQNGSRSLVNCRRVAWLFLAISLVAADDPAPPAIEPGGVWNAAGRVPPSLSGGALAPGGRFTISGVRMGPPQPAAGNESDPPETLASVTVRVGAARAGLFSVSAERIDGWIPTSVPPGPTQIVVTYQGRASEPYALTIAPASFGFFPPDPTPSAVPGETLTLSGSGLGTTEPEVWVGQKRVGNAHRADSPPCCKGVDRVAFQVPADAPLGCAVPVIARAAGRTSNAIQIDLHAPGQPCRDQVDWLRESVEHARRAGFMLLAHVSLASIRQFAQQNFEFDFDFDYAVAAFGRQEIGQRQFPPLPPPHTCTAITDRINLRQWKTNARSPSGWTMIPKKAEGNRRLDAGPWLRAGSKQLLPNASGSETYDALLGGRVPFSRDKPTPLFLPHSSITVSGAGGSDVGPFSVSVPLAAPLVWKNRARIHQVDRAAGVTVDWKPSRRNDAVLVMIASADGATGDSGLCLCVAPAREGRFTIPPLWLANLPPNENEERPGLSALALIEIPVEPPVRITATGLDRAYAAFVSVSGRPLAVR